MKKIITSIVLLSGILPFFAFSLDALQSNKNTITFESGSGNTQYISVKNRSPKKAFAILTIKKIINPGTLKMRYETNKNPKLLGLMVSPSKLILKNNQSRKVKIIRLLTNNSKDIVYLLDGRYAKVPKKIADNTTSSTTNIEISLGFNTTIILKPKVLKPKIDSKIVSNKLYITNTGNTTVSLSDIKQCQANNVCKNIPSVTLYPDDDTERMLPYTGIPVSLTMIYGKKSKNIIVK